MPVFQGSFFLSLRFPDFVQCSNGDVWNHSGNISCKPKVNLLPPYYVRCLLSSMPPPAAFPSQWNRNQVPASRPVSGLTSFDLPPSHDCSQWLIGKSTLAYRCGGSTGFGVNASLPVSRLTERLAPFCTLEQTGFYQMLRRSLSPKIPKHLQNILLPIDLTGFLNL